MPRSILLLVILLIIIVGALFFLSGRATEVPTRTVEVEVEVGGSGNAQ